MIFANLAEFVVMNGVRRSERIALQEGARSLNYAQLLAAFDSYAGFLQQQGVKRGEVVGLTMRDGIDHMVAMLAIIRLGAILLPIDARWTSVEKDNVARTFGATHVVSDAVETCVLTSATVIAHDADAQERGIPVELPQDFSADEPLLMSLSSGTTGTPKGPRLTHRQMMLRLHAEWLSMGFHPDDVNLCATPLYFGGGRGFTLSYLMCGATVVFCAPPYRPADVAALIREHKVTTTFLVPTLLRRVSEASPDVLEATRSLRFIISSGSALHPSERSKMLEQVNAHIINYYASTEGGGVSLLFGDEDGEVAGSVGRPMLGSHLCVTDDDGNPLAVREIGHIRQRASWHPEGFHQSPSESARFFREGWYLPGDLGYLDESGYLFITGRSKDMIIRGGINIYPNEIESVLVSHPAISDAAVVPRPSQQFGEDVVAFVVADPASIDAERLAEHCKASLATYKVPSEFIFVPELPRNSGGKVVKAELIQQLAETTAQAATRGVAAHGA